MGQASKMNDLLCFMNTNRVNTHVRVCVGFSFLVRLNDGCMDVWNDFYCIPNRMIILTSRKTRRKKCQSPVIYMQVMEMINLTIHTVRVLKRSEKIERELNLHTSH